MNVNDSEKVAGLLLADGYERADGGRGRGLRLHQHLRRAREGGGEALPRARPPEAAEGREARPGRSAWAAAWRSSRARASWSARRTWTCSWARTTSPACPSWCAAPAPASPAAWTWTARPTRSPSPTRAVAHTSAVRAYVTAIEGCNHVCSFCVVPAHARARALSAGRRRSWREVRSLVDRGYPEVMLLGQTVNAYRHGGRGLRRPARARARGAGTAPPALHDVASGARGRRGWPTPSATCRALCPYLHLPVQSGSDRILESMRRGYTRAAVPRHRRAAARAACPTSRCRATSSSATRARPRPTSRPPLTWSTRSAFDGLFVFTYSPRPGTTAAAPGRRRARRRRSCAASAC